MMKVLPWQGRVAIIFLLLAVVFNLIHYTVFRDTDYIFKFILAQLGFLPISVYLVTVVINQLLSRREKQAMLKKLNMVIGSFYSEVGTELLRFMVKGETVIPSRFLVNSEWQEEDYNQALTGLKEFDPGLNHEKINWRNLRTFLIAEKHFLLSLLGNPNLLEHESFTELLWAVFHLAEELSFRKDVTALSLSDYEHLTGDIKRAYILLLAEWLAYMKHLQEEYPYLFSLALRTNPFNPTARVEIN